MNANNIYIMSDAVHSGKTTTLQQWLRNKATNTAGILAPDIDGRRKLYDITRKEYHEFEMAGEYIEQGYEEALMIGRYRFSRHAFNIAQNILLRSMEENPDWLIVDEVGKLEVDDKGLEPALSELVEFYKMDKAEGKLVLVVRDYLLGAVVEKYGLNTDMILHKAFFE